LQVMVSTGFLAADDVASRTRILVFLEMLRMLFGDEVVGFSMREDLRCLCTDFDSKSLACEHIGRILSRRVPYLDDTWSKQILRPALYDNMRLAGLHEPTFPSSAQDLLGFMLPTARWARSEEMVSYIEYVRDHVRNSFKHHPHHMLYSYFMYRCDFARLEVDAATRERVLRVICQQGIIGLPLLFPRLLHEKARADDLTTVVCQDVDPSDLRAVIAGLKRGLGPNWEACRKHWEVEGITDVTTFVQLVSIWPGVLRYVSKQNLFDLMESSGSEGEALARGILHEMGSEKLIGTEAMDLCAMVSWWCYRNQGCLGVELIDDDGAKHFASTADGHLFKIPGLIKVELQVMLCWASAYSYHHTRVFGMEVRDFEQALKHDLLVASAHEGAPLWDLWGHSFAFLLDVEGEIRGLPWMQIQALASSHFPPPQEWPLEARAMSELWAQKMHPSFAEVLAVDPFFEMLRALQVREPSRVERYLRHLILSVHDAQCPLPYSMQVKLLKSGLAPPDEVARKALVSTFMAGLKVLRQEGVQSSMPACKFRDCLQTFACDEGLAAVIPALISAEEAV